MDGMQNIVLLVSSCLLVLAHPGFYEWKKEKDGKQPYYIHSKQSPVLRMAGLWDEWAGKHGRMGMTFTNW